MVGGGSQFCKVTMEKIFFKDIMNPCIGPTYERTSSNILHHASVEVHYIEYSKAIVKGADESKKLDDLQ